ncbi:MAG: hypothetical protein OXU20_33910 [Myxococcales bacterium]|nr:hypothetical protein [Myxococcales bacterium]MDD9967458.1 hypothetical protein [Myxococcales bacterium]
MDHGPARSRATTAGRLALLLGPLGLAGCGGVDASDAASNTGGEAPEQAPFVDLGEFSALGDPGGQTSDGTGLITADAAGGGCASELATIVVDEVKEPIAVLGFAPAELLAWVDADDESTVTWDPAGSAAMASPPASETLRLTITRDDGEARFFDGTIGVNPGEEPAGTCPPYVELDVTAELTTADGTLSEHFPAILRAGRREVVELVGAFDMGSLGGSLAFEPRFEINGGNASWADVEYEGILVQAVYTPHGSHGRLSAHTHDAVQLRGQRAPISAPIPVLAVWPADVGCAPPPGPWKLTSNLAIAGDTEVLGQTADAWRGLFGQLPPLALGWEGGRTSTLTAQVEVTSEACYWTEWLQEDATLSYGVRVSATTDDDSFVGEYPGFVTVRRVTSGHPDIVGHTLASLDVGMTVDIADINKLGVPAAAAAAEMEAARAGALSELWLSWGIGLNLDARTLGGRLRLGGERSLACDDTDPLTQDSCLASLSEVLLEASSHPKP